LACIGRVNKQITTENDKKTKLLTRQADSDAQIEKAKKDLIEKEKLLSAQQKQ